MEVKSKNKLVSFIEKIFYALSANMLSLLVSVLTTLFVPKLFGEQTGYYGIFQIYLFYVGYIGFFHFGWCDGIFLKEGGKNYNDLNKSLYSTQFWIFTLLEFFIASIIWICGLLFANESSSRFIIECVSISIVIYLPRVMLAYILQCTNRIKEYSRITVIGRGIYGLCIIVILVFKIRYYQVLILADLFGKLCGLFTALYLCKDIVFGKLTSVKYAYSEAFKNISIGVKLMFANIASQLTIGVVNWSIQKNWSIEIYGKISFTLSVSNLLLIFINAVALVLYPTLRNIDNVKLLDLFKDIRYFLKIPLLGMLVLYYPLEVLLSAWLPQYAEGMKYMAILFPLCIYATEMTMLIQTYMQVLRLENLLLRSNIVSVIFAAIISFVSAFVLQNLTLTMLTMVICQMFRCIYAEINLTKKMGLDITKDIILETCMTVVFIISSWYIGGIIGVSLYFSAYIVYLFIKRADIKNISVKYKLLKDT